MKRVGIIGASGFIGSHLSHRLMGNHEYEACLSDLNQDKLSLRFENADYPFEVIDISKDLERLDELVSSVDVIFDLVSYVHPRMFLRRPLDVVRLNFFDCVKVVESCVRHGTRLIHFSTSEVYGKTGGSNSPFQEDETDLILGPIRNQRWIYSSAKQLLDRIIYAHGVENSLEYTLVRPFNFIGPLMDKYVEERSEDDSPRVLASFMSALVFGKPLQLVDGGHNKRVFTYIGDAIDALELILENQSATNRQIINVGNPANELTIADLAHRMVALYVREFDRNARPEIRSISSKEFYGDGYEDCDRRMPDISKMAALGWQPKHDIDETLFQSMEYWVRNKDRLIARLGA